MMIFWAVRNLLTPSPKFYLVLTTRKGIVIGLYGKWGVGKSSVVNMLLEHISNIKEIKEDEKPIVLEFNAWNFSEQNQLISIFL